MLRTLIARAAGRLLRRRLRRLAGTPASGWSLRVPLVTLPLVALLVLLALAPHARSR